MDTQALTPEYLIKRALEDGYLERTEQDGVFRITDKESYFFIGKPGKLLTLKDITY